MEPGSATPGRAPTALLTLLAVGVGGMVANLYYAQPLIASIGPEIGVSPNLGGSIVSVTQMGYGFGLLLLVSVADLVENKRLVLTLMGLTILGLVGVATSSGALMFFVASFLIGLCASGAQVLLPFVAHLVPEEGRGRVVGNVMAGVLTGIMLARPAALFVSASFGWRAVFWGSAVLLSGIAVALWRMMPVYKPVGGRRYGQNLVSMVGLVRTMGPLRWRAAYAFLMFGSFNMFWTAAPLMLADRFGLGEHGIGLFALAGAGGALVAPWAGRAADRGWERPATGVAMVVLGVSFLGTGWAAAASMLWVMAGLGLLIDGAVQANQVLSRRTVFGVRAAVRGRVNSIYMTITFIGGAVGSMLGSVTYHRGGWGMTAGTGVAIGVVLVVLFALEGRSSGDG